MAKYSQVIEVRGHLIDSLILTKIFDEIMDVKGEFEVQEISIGKKKNDQSYARLLVQGINKEQKENLVKLFLADKILEYKGEVSLPV